VYIGYLLNNLIQSHPFLLKDEQKAGVYLKYSQLVISLAEKSVKCSTLIFVKLKLGLTF
jgi:hypothetical protein